MYCWGSTIHGELGLGGIEEEQVICPRPLQWHLAKDVTSVACGETHSLLATNNGKIYSCGNNDYGQLGHDQPRKRPQLVTGLDSYIMTQVACGDSHSLAINQWGQVFSWGSDSHGQLGHKLDGENQPVPKIIRSLATSNIVQISCGKKHSLALTNAGELYAWGANSHGQLGIGKISQYETKPTLVKSLAGIPVAFIVCGGDHSFVVSYSGAVYGWGKNTFGQLGLNNDVSQVYPCQLKTLRSVGVMYIACGEEYSVFLTKDGGVFSCGSGSYGQLGHGTTSNEILPRKVLELMGSTITQVSCGRRHTLAFVPSRGRIYGFGLGGSGQLGRQIGNATTPQIVLGPWVSPSGIPDVASSEASCVIKRMFAGGDHCFVTVTPINANESPYDCRIANPETQILTLTTEQLHLYQNMTNDSVVDQDLWVYLETVFKSLACINRSFLLPNKEHYCCTSRHHGIDLVAAEEGFSAIGKTENTSIRNLILHCVTEDLLKQLIPSPPDVETLRVYITLPLYHEFSNPKHHDILHRPFAQALRNLKPAPKKVIESWWNLCSVEYFERLIQIFKDVVCFILDLQKIPQNKTVSWNASLVSSLDILAQLNKLNHSIEGLKVPYDTFHLSNLDQYLDVRIDYVSWLSDSSSDKLYLCNYPFLFNAEAKTVLLQTDQTIQMENAMHQAATQAFIALLSNHPLIEISQFLTLNVTRENIVLDTLRELPQVNTNDLKKPLKVKFLGEEADDAGGVRKEFFMLLLREIFDPKYGMFKEYEESRLLWFSEDSFEDEVMYLLIGILCGLAIYNFTIIDLPFPLALFKKLLEEPVTLADLRELSPMVANSLQQLLKYTEPDFEDVFNLNFYISKNVYGEVKTIPLKPNGENIQVTLENKEEYVNLYVDYIFNKSVQKHYNAFSKGFLKVCGGRVLKLFHSHELRAVIVGNQNYDWHVLESGAEYKNGYSSSDQVIQWFWEVFHELPLEDKKKFLLFLTGSDRIPITGMKSVKITIQPTTDEKFLPVAHTCFNLLDLPRYNTKERLRYKLLQAIQQTEGFSLV